MKKGVDYVTAGKKSGVTLGTRATAEGNRVTASGYASHAQGNADEGDGDDNNIIASATGSFAGGNAQSNYDGDSNTIIASGSGSIAYGHAECDSSIKSTRHGSFACGEAFDSGIIQSTNDGSFACGEAEGADSNISSTGVGSFAGGTANGSGVIASGDGSFAYGCVYSSNSAMSIYSTGSGSVAFGSVSTGKIESLSEGTFAFGCSTDEGSIKAADYGSFAGGYSSTSDGIIANGEAAFAFGYGDIYVESGAVGIGEHIYNTGTHSCALGCGLNTVISHQALFGKYNVESDSNADRFIVGKGSTDNSRANCFRVTDASGVYASGSYNASGADYAEMFEWKDNNPDKEDRRGRFVTIDGDKIKLAESIEEFILGIVSGNPSVCGDVHDDQWKGMYLYDIFGRPLYEEVEVPEKTRVRKEKKERLDEDGNPVKDENGKTIFDVEEVIEVVEEAHTETRQKLNPDYDNTVTYIPRSERPEWDAIGMLGKLIMVDDSTSEVNGYVKPTTGGIATKSDDKTKFRVMKRLDNTHIQVLILR